MQARILHSFLKTKFAKQDQHTFCSTDTPGQLQSKREVNNMTELTERAQRAQDQVCELSCPLIYPSQTLKAYHGQVKEARKKPD